MHGKALLPSFAFSHRGLLCGTGLGGGIIGRVELIDRLSKALSSCTPSSDIVERLGASLVNRNDWASLFVLRSYGVGVGAVVFVAVSLIDKDLHGPMFGARNKHPFGAPSVIRSF